MRTLKFVSDGTPHGSCVIDAETGEPIRGVESVSLSATVGQPFVHATISLHRIEVEAIAQVQGVVERQLLSQKSEPVQQQKECVSDDEQKEDE